MPDRKFASIVDVARKAGVSTATVSRYLNNPDIVKAQTGKRIEKAVAELDYVRNRAASSLHNRRTATIGLVVPTIDYAIFAEMMEAFSQRLMSHGFTTLIGAHGYDLDIERRLIRALMERSVDAIVLTGLDHRSESLSMMERREVPFLSVWNYSRDCTFPCIGIDNVRAGRATVEHLVALGHRRIAVLAGQTRANDRAEARCRGALAALEEAGCERREDWIRSCPYDIGDAKAHALRILESKDRPTAFACGNDIIALGVLFAAQSLGLSVPHDLSIMGIGDFRLSEHTHPALTTLRIPARRIGSLAADAIVGLVDGAPLDAPIEVETELKLRESTTPLPSRS